MTNRFPALMRAGLAGLTTICFGGCAATPHFDLEAPAPAVHVSQSALPTAVQPYPRIERVLSCIRKTGIIRKRVFVVGSFADSTGKINAVATGATGNFVPQGGSASYITDAIRKAGGKVISTYFGPPARQKTAHYAINGIFNSLDFNAPMSADLRVGGIGPVAGSGWAQLTLSIQLDQADTRLNEQMSMIQRPVKFQQAGVGVGRDFNSLLVTGTVVLRNQERLQFEALNGPIALGVADVLMKEFPKAADRCRGIVADLLETLS
ncbi:MAG: hypothetical protein KTR19_10290 [Hyphomicrobiales bacterium]|nr:hypothetical protein [Hyphomicrobiales bacterium]